jgi:putative ABC transport system permease protein
MNESRKYPPRLFIRFLRWFCHPELHDYIEGDLLEIYQRRLKNSGKERRI